MKRNIMALTVMAALSSTAVAAENTWKDDTKDAWIDGKAEAALLFNSELNSFEIDTDVENGKVTLSGDVESQTDKALAEKVVREIDGVMSVDNMLIVKMMDSDDMDEESHQSRTAMNDADDMDNMDNDVAHSAMGENKVSSDMSDNMSDMNTDSTDMAIADTSISASVKSRLLRESDISTRSINVDVDNRVVTLKGTVKSESERELALAIAKETDNVDAVNDELTIEKDY